MPKYKISNLARQDLIRIYQYGLVRFGQNQADKYFDQLFSLFDRIAERPYAFQSVDHIKSGYRRCVSGNDSIFYRIQSDTIEIMTVVGQQDIDRIFN